MILGTSSTHESQTCNGVTGSDTSCGMSNTGSGGKHLQHAAMSSAAGSKAFITASNVIVGTDTSCGMSLETSSTIRNYRTPSENTVREKNYPVFLLKNEHWHEHRRKRCSGNGSSCGSSGNFAANCAAAERGCPSKRRSPRQPAPPLFLDDAVACAALSWTPFACPPPPVCLMQRARALLSALVRKLFY